MCPTAMPIRSTRTEFPKRREKASRTHGKYGAWKLSRPKKFIRTYGFRLLHTYTSIMVNAWPRNKRLTNSAITIIRLAPKTNMRKKSAVLPLNEPSSSMRQ